MAAFIDSNAVMITPEMVTDRNSVDLSGPPTGRTDFSMTNDAGSIMAGMGGSLSEKEDDTAYNGQRQSPKKRPTKKIVTAEERKQNRKQARKARKRNRK